MKEYLEFFEEEFDTTVEDKCSPSNKPYVAYSPVSGVAYTTPVTAQAVDLGLSVKWASCNIGATFPEETGDYFAWGEVEPKEDYFQDYKWGEGNFMVTGKPSKYNIEDKLWELLPEDDAAHVNWGGKWRMPTNAEYVELIENCTYERCTLNGVNGIKMISNINSNWIFFPTTGVITDVEVDSEFNSEYWSKSLIKMSEGSVYQEEATQYAFAFDFSSEWSPDPNPSANVIEFRMTGCNIRPVCS